MGRVRVERRGEELTTQTEASPLDYVNASNVLYNTLSRRQYTDSNTRHAVPTVPTLSFESGSVGHLLLHVLTS